MCENRVNAYRPDQERAVRLLHRLKDWRDSELISREQHDRMAGDLDTGLRRTNVFLRATLFVFGTLIVLAAIGLTAVTFRPGQYTVWLLFAAPAGACYAAATVLVRRYRLYRFGIEEAFVVAAILWSGGAAAFSVEPFTADDIGFGIGFMAAAAVGFVCFFQFGYEYAAVIAMASAALAPFQLVESDIARRSIGAAILALMFFVARLEREKHGDEFPGDSYGILETAAWAGIYLLLNLKVSAWLSHPVEAGPYYWLTYALIWMLPAAGLWIAMRQRHRLMLDLNIILAIATLMSNKPYLNAGQKPWDPIAFGLLLIAVALGTRRWLASGEGGARSGLVPFRLLASERERLAAAGTASVMQPSPHPQHAPAEPQPGFGGGRSGGGGATGSL